MALVFNPITRRFSREETDGRNHIDPDRMVYYPPGQTTEAKTYREAIIEIIKKSLLRDENRDTQRYRELIANDEMASEIADDVINSINLRSDAELSALNIPSRTWSLTGKGTQEMNPNVLYLVYSAFPGLDNEDPRNPDFDNIVNGYSTDTYSEIPKIANNTDMSHAYYRDNGRFSLGEEITSPQQIWNKFVSDTTIEMNLTEAAASRFSRTSLNNIRTAWEDYAINQRDISFSDFLDIVIKPSIDATGSIGYIVGNPGVDMLHDEFAKKGILSFDDISPNYLQEWNKMSAIVELAYDQHLAKLRILQDRKYAGENENKINAEEDALILEWSSWLSNIVNNFPTEEEMRRNEQLLTPEGRQQILFKNARDTGVMQTGTMEGISTSLARAFEEIEKRYMEAGPDANYDQIVEDYMGVNGEKFQSRFGSTPPAMPGLPSYEDAQNMYKDIVARGGTAKDIMDAIYGITPYESTPEQASQAKMLQDAGIATDIDISQAMASGDRDALREVLINKGLYYATDEETVMETGTESLTDLATMLLGQQEKNKFASVGAGAYVQEQYIPPKEIDSRLYAPAPTNVRPQDLPKEGDPGTVRYDAEGIPLGRLYSDIIDEETAKLDTAQKKITDRAAQLGINPDEYTPGDDPDLDAAFAAFDALAPASLATKSQAEEGLAEAEASIAMDETGAKAPHEIDDTPPPPAPEMTQFTTRTRGGRRGY